MWQIADDEPVRHLRVLHRKSPGHAPAPVVPNDNCPVAPKMFDDCPHVFNQQAHIVILFTFGFVAEVVGRSRRLDSLSIAPPSGGATSTRNPGSRGSSRSAGRSRKRARASR